jgi:hypothetical protein
MQDVLLTPGELLAGDVHGLFNACSTAGAHCVVSGLVPGAIDSVSPFYARPIDGNAPTAVSSAMVGHAYSFRCVIDASTKASQ